jgi:anthraniloyl-CoA monooxygenase
VEVDLTDPWGEAGDALVKRLHELTPHGRPGFLLTGADDRGAVLTRLDVGERLRAETGALVVVDGPATSLDDLASGLASGRTDLVCVTDTDSDPGDLR